MAIMYKIKCRHCGMEFQHFASADYGTLRACVGCECHVETQMAIRCPGCLRKLNNTQEEFNSQVETIFEW